MIILYRKEAHLNHSIQNILTDYLHLCEIAAVTVEVSIDEDKEEDEEDEEDDGSLVFSEKGIGVIERRVRGLVRGLMAGVYEDVCRSLFAKDRLLLA